MIVLITGKMGTGKTITLIHQILIHLRIDQTVAANIKLNIPSNTLLQTFETTDDLLKIVDSSPPVPDCIAIDMAEPYFSQRTDPILTDLLSSKLRRYSEHNTLYLTTQYTEALPKLIRSNIGMTLECSFHGLNVKAKITFDPRGYFDMYDTHQIIAH